MFHVKHYSVGWPFIAIPEASAVVLLQPLLAFVIRRYSRLSGSLRDAQSFWEQDVQPRFVLISWSAGIKPIIAVTDLHWEQ